MKTRKCSFDVLRCIAILFVLINHRDIYSYFLNFDVWNIKYVISMIISIFCKSACPIFFMISGALLLGKEETYYTIFVHRICRILSAMVLFSIVYIICNQGTIEMLGGLLLRNSNWYLYAYLAFLIMLPFFRSMVQGMDKVKFRIFLVLVAVFYAMPVFISSGILGNLTLFCAPWASSSWHIVFPILGYYYTHWNELEVGEKEKKLQKVIISVGTIVSIAVCIILMSNDIVQKEGQNLEMLRQYAILFPTCLIFVAINEHNEKVSNLNNKLKQIIFTASVASFGIFLLEVYTPINNLIDQFLQANLVTNYITMYIYIIIELVVDTVIITILREIPLLKTIL